VDPPPHRRRTSSRRFLRRIELSWSRHVLAPETRSHSERILSLTHRGPRGLLPSDKDEDGRRDGPRLKAPSQVLTRATRTPSVLHALNRRLRDSSLPRSPSLSRLRASSSSVHLLPTSDVSRGCSPRIVFRVRVRPATLVKIFWRSPRGIRATRALLQISRSFPERGSMANPARLVASAVRGVIWSALLVVVARFEGEICRSRRHAEGIYRSKKRAIASGVTCTSVIARVSCSLRTRGMVGS